MSAGKPLLEGRSLRKTYRARTVVNDVGVTAVSYTHLTLPTTPYV